VKEYAQVRVECEDKYRKKIELNADLTCWLEPDTEVKADHHMSTLVLVRDCSIVSCLRHQLYRGEVSDAMLKKQ